VLTTNDNRRRVTNVGSNPSVQSRYGRSKTSAKVCRHFLAVLRKVAAR
jgi:hypothetical protein